MKQSLSKTLNKNFQEKVDQIRSLFDDYKIEQAQRLLEQLKPRSISEYRRKAHFIAEGYFLNGDLSQAQSLLEKARNDFGSNLSIELDLLSIYYLQNNFHLWETKTREIQKLYSQIQSNLSQKTKMKYSLSIGNSLEELGEINEALALYEESIKNHKFKDEVYLKLIAQIIRLLSYYQQESSSLNHYYRDLISFQKDNYALDFIIEIEHALVLAETCLFGAKISRIRLQSLLRNDRISNYDIQLVIIDYLELLIAQNNLTDSESNEWLKYLPEKLGPYEEIIHRLTQHPKSIITMEMIQEYKSKLPLAGFIRIACLSSRFLDALERHCLQKQVLSLLSTVSSQSRAMWIDRFSIFLLEPKKGFDLDHYTFDTKNLRITVLGTSIDLSTRPALFALSQNLIREKRMDIDQLCHILYNSEFNESYYHRIRLSVRRLNELVFQKSGKKNFLRILQGTVRLCT